MATMKEKGKKGTIKSLYNSIRFVCIEERARARI